MLDKDQSGVGWAGQAAGEAAGHRRKLSVDSEWVGPMAQEASTEVQSLKQLEPMSYPRLGVPRTAGVH